MGDFMNTFKYSNTNKRYHTLDYYYKNLFNSKVFKISLNAGFSCPNIDGKVGHDGCIYCTRGSGEFENINLLKQFNMVKNIMEHKWHGKYIGYFQAHTNTYAPLDVLKEKFELILKQDNVIGLSIATRCDAIEDDVFEYLVDLNKRTFLTIELGLQTIHPETSKLINRCHTLECFDNMVKRLRNNNINVVVHIINGLPYETPEMMIETVKHLNRLDITGIKIHMLHILKDTALEKMYLKDKFHILTKEEYIDVVIKQLEVMDPKIVINRITGDPKVDDLIEPKWLVKKTILLNDIDKGMVKRDTYQGALFTN